MRFPIVWLLAIMAGLLALPASGAAHVSTGLAGTVPASLTGSSATAGTGVFQAVCSFSHRRADDPIVLPGAPGGSHSHDFFGSTTTSAFSTPQTIGQGPTSCIRHGSATKQADSSAYWVPTLYAGGQAVTPTELSAYYTAGVGDVRAIEPFPVGLQVIAGTSSGGPQEVDAERVWFFMCPEAELVRGSATTAPTCSTDRIDLELRFPDCWNGRDLDSPNHKSHMAYSRRAQGAAVRTCPATHPRAMPKLHLKLRYPTPGGAGVRLSSGAIDTAHADFVNGWDQAGMAALVRDCLNVDLYCGGDDLPSKAVPTAVAGKPIRPLARSAKQHGSRCRKPPRKSKARGRACAARKVARAAKKLR